MATNTLHERAENRPLGYTIGGPYAGHMLRWCEHLSMCDTCMLERISCLLALPRRFKACDPGMVVTHRTRRIGHMRCFESAVTMPPGVVQRRGEADQTVR
jgi:hypothetical protein